MRRSGLRPLSLLVAFTLGVAGCVVATPPPTPPTPPTKYFVASIDTSSSTTAASTDGLKVLDPRAAEALRPGATVAFFPPNACRADVAAADTTATAESVEMANECGVLISSLETSVAGRYSVVSWQTLKGADPFARAEARNVDVIFEVDSMGMNALGQDAASDLQMAFYEQSNATDRTGLTLGAADLSNVAHRCKTGVEQMQAQSAGMVGSYTAAIKAVEVKSGQSLLYYQRTLTDDPGKATTSSFDMYFESRPPPLPTTPPVDSRKYNNKQMAGVGLIAAGPALMITSVVLFSEGSDGRCYNSAGFYCDLYGGAFMGVGLGLVATGIALLILGNRKAKASGSVAVRPAPVYPPPQDVLCVQPTTPPWMAPQWEGPKPADAQGGSTYSFSETQSAGRDTARERENRLRQLAIDDFTGQLATLGTGG